MYLFNTPLQCYITMTLPIDIKCQAILRVHRSAKKFNKNKNFLFLKNWIIKTYLPQYLHNCSFTSLGFHLLPQSFPVYHVIGLKIQWKNYSNDFHNQELMGSPSNETISVQTKGIIPLQTKSILMSSCLNTLFLAIGIRVSQEPGMPGLH